MKRVLNAAILAGAATLVACATPAPAPERLAPAAAVAPNVIAPPTAATGSPEKIPFGYQRVVLSNGEERFCRNDLTTGSRTERTKVCLTAAQLKASQDNSQDFINSVQAHGGQSTPSTTPGGAGALGH